MGQRRDEDEARRHRYPGRQNRTKLRLTAYAAEAWDEKTEDDARGSQEESQVKRRYAGRVRAITKTIVLLLPLGDHGSSVNESSASGTCWWLNDPGLPDCRQ